MEHYIYKITNLINGKYYIGKRSCKGLAINDKYMGSGKILKNAIKLHGIENFKKEILEYADCSDNAYLLEEQYVTIKELEDPNCYNLVLGGKLHGSIPRKLNQNYGKKRTIETINKIRKSNIGQKRSKECKKNISNAVKGELHVNYGKHHSEETKEKIRNSNKGKVLSDETKEKISNANKGRSVPEETKMKISEKQKGKIISEETRKKISNANKGRSVSEETKKKSSETRIKNGTARGENNPMYSKKHSEETRKKMSEKAKGKKRIFSEEHRKNLSKAGKGRVFSTEHKENISKSKKLKSKK